jgi:putative two-component system response regulator
MANPNRSKIILVDDNKSELDQGHVMLSPFYEVYPAISAAKLFELTENVIPDLILLDVAMPEMDGFEAIRKLKEDSRLVKVPVIFLTSKSDPESELEGFELGASDYVSKPFSAPILLKRIEKELLLVRQKNELYRNKDFLEEYANQLTAEVIDKTKEVYELQNALLTTVADMVEIKDAFTGGHIWRTRRYLEILVNEMVEWDIYREEMLGWDHDIFLSSAQLHDVGKIAIPDSILNKPGKLTPEEFETIKRHVTVGVEAIERIMKSANEHNAFLVHARAIVGTHHEKWDGSGYPNALKGKAIPLQGRLMALADVYDALVSERPYKKAFPHEEAYKIIEDSTATHFDPTIVDVFCSVEAEFTKVARENRPKPFSFG